MKRIDYFWPRAAFQITGIIFLTQVVTEIIANRMPGFEWVFEASAIAFMSSIVWVAYAVCMNAFLEGEKQ